MNERQAGELHRRAAVPAEEERARESDQRHGPVSALLGLKQRERKHEQHGHREREPAGPVDVVDAEQQRERAEDDERQQPAEHGQRAAHDEGSRRADPDDRDGEVRAVARHVPVGQRAGRGRRVSVGGEHDRAREHGVEQRQPQIAGLEAAAAELQPRELGVKARQQHERAHAQIDGAERAEDAERGPPVHERPGREARGAEKQREIDRRQASARRARRARRRRRIRSTETASITPAKPPVRANMGRFGQN